MFSPARPPKAPVEQETLPAKPRRDVLVQTFWPSTNLLPTRSRARGETIDLPVGQIIAAFRAILWASSSRIRPRLKSIFVRLFNIIGAPSFTPGEILLPFFVKVCFIAAVPTHSRGVRPIVTRRGARDAMDARHRQTCGVMRTAKACRSGAPAADAKSRGSTTQGRRRQQSPVSPG